MKLTESRLRSIIREELSQLNEARTVRHIPSMDEERLNQLGNGKKVNVFQSVRQFLDLAGVNSIREFGQKYRGMVSKAVAGTQANKADKYTLVLSPRGFITCVTETYSTHTDSMHYFASTRYFKPPNKYKENWTLATGAGNSSGEGFVPREYVDNLDRLIEERGVDL